jgi:hypothetical protein
VASNHILKKRDMIVSFKYNQSTKMGASQAKMESNRGRGRGTALDLTSGPPSKGL